MSAPLLPAWIPTPKILHIGHIKSITVPWRTSSTIAWKNYADTIFSIKLQQRVQALGHVFVIVLDDNTLKNSSHWISFSTINECHSSRMIAPLSTDIPMLAQAVLRDNLLRGDVLWKKGIRTQIYSTPKRMKKREMVQIFSSKFDFNHTVAKKYLADTTHCNTFNL